MDQEILVKEALTESMIDAGADLLRALDALGWPVTAAFWYYGADSNRWDLYFASPEVGKEGSFKAYGVIRRAGSQVSPRVSKLLWDAVTVVDTNERPASLLRPLVRTELTAVSDLRFTHNAVNGHYIEDAYVYRMT